MLGHVSMPAQQAHHLKVLDVQGFHSRVVLQRLNHGIDLGRLGVSAHVVLQPQDAPLGLELCGVVPDHGQQLPEGLRLHTRNDM